MDIKDLANKKIGIIGFGVEGQSVAKYLAGHAMPFSVFNDNADISADAPTAQLLQQAVEVHMGPDYLNKIAACEVLFLTPAVPLDLPQIKAAIAQGTILTSQLEYFFENFPTKNIIGITGTKGKGTTSQLIYEILKKAGLPVYLAGNIGLGAIDLLDKLEPADYVVLELSSFQLEKLHHSPHIAVVLMVTADHLDYHHSLETYLNAKGAITKYQSSGDFAVVNIDFESSKKIGAMGEAQKQYVQTLPAAAVAQNQPFKIYNPEDYIKISSGVFAEELLGNIYIKENGRIELFANIKNFPLRGFHMVQNICAAICIALILKVRKEVVLEVLLSFKGLEHRLEFIAERAGIKFYNDSIGTTVDTAIAAARAFNEPEILILGGRGAGGDYLQLAATLSSIKNVKAVILIGEEAETLKEGFATADFKGIILNGAKNMSEIFAQIREVAAPGDVVLLSPGAKSFDMFKNYKERGEQFRRQSLEY